jgi:hypothetical protein
MSLLYVVLMDHAGVGFAEVGDSMRQGVRAIVPDFIAFGGFVPALALIQLNRPAVRK